MRTFLLLIMLAFSCGATPNASVEYAKHYDLYVDYTDGTGYYVNDVRAMLVDFEEGVCAVSSNDGEQYDVPLENLDGWRIERTN